MSSSRPIIVRTAVIAIIGVVAIVVFGPALAQWRPSVPASTVLAAADPNDPISGITVQGMGKVTISPDLATLTVAVQSQAKTAAEAQSKASGTMARVIDAVKAQGIADADIATQWISLEPQYDYNTNGTTPPRVTGYASNQGLSVKVHPIAKVGPVIDAAVGAGANQVSGINFSVADPTAATAQARTAAVADAKARATALAQAAGVSLGNPTSISEVSAPGPIPYPYAQAAPAAGRDTMTPVQPGTLEIEVDVQVTFAIAG